jgi:hypothetical protein
VSAGIQSRDKLCRSSSFSVRHRKAIDAATENTDRGDRQLPDLRPSPVPASEMQPESAPSASSMIPLLIGIINAKDELTIVVASPQPVKQSGSHPANMHVSGWAWSESSSNGHGA